MYIDSSICTTFIPGPRLSHFKCPSYTHMPCDIAINVRNERMKSGQHNNQNVRITNFILDQTYVHICVQFISEIVIAHEYYSLTDPQIVCYSCIRNIKKKLIIKLNQTNKSSVWQKTKKSININNVVFLHKTVRYLYYY